MSSLRGVVFDADGTIFDTASLIYDAYHHIAEMHGYEKPSREQVAKEMGRPIPEIIEALFPGADVAAMMSSNTDFVMSRATTVVAFDGLRELLKQLRSLRIKLAILTSGGEKIYSLLEHNNLSEFFGSIIHADRVTNHKPHPEGFKLAAAELQLEVNQLLMVGDMRQDIEVAANAGALGSVGITHGFGSRETLEKAGADYVIDSLPELLGVVDDIRSI